jgi:SNF family Na+-dependent transporter
VICFSVILGIGYASLATNCFLALYYNVLIAYCFYYLVASFQLVVPWATCGNWWNTAMCTDQIALANLSRTDLDIDEKQMSFRYDKFTK